MIAAVPRRQLWLLLCDPITKSQLAIDIVGWLFVLGSLLAQYTANRKQDHGALLHTLLGPLERCAKSGNRFSQKQCDRTKC